MDGRNKTTFKMSREKGRKKKRRLPRNQLKKSGSRRAQIGIQKVSGRRQHHESN